MSDQLKRHLAKPEAHSDMVFEHKGPFEYLRIEHSPGALTLPPPQNPDIAFVQVYALTPESHSDALGRHNVFTLNAKSCRNIGNALLGFADRLDEANAPKAKPK